MIEVTLTDREVKLGVFAAMLRDEAGRAARADNGKYGNCQDAMRLHVQGCLGELAAAKGLNRYWDGGGTRYHEDSDLGGIQVRSTEHAGGRLLIRPEEAERETIMDPWVLVIRRDDAHYRLIGWIYGYEGICPEFLTAPAGRQPAYFVPQDWLRKFPILAP